MGTQSIIAALIIATTTLTPNAASSQASSFTLRGADVRDGTPLPLIHEASAPSLGCRGKNVTLSLRWSGVPTGTRGFALTMIDPNVTQVPGGFVHWVTYNIPASARTIGPRTTYTYSKGTMGAGLIGYFGPCPPVRAAAHHYHLTLYALGVAHVSGAHLTLAALQTALTGYILGTASLVGTFKRPSRHPPAGRLAAPPAYRAAHGCAMATIQLLQGDALRRAQRGQVTAKGRLLDDKPVPHWCLQGDTSVSLPLRA